MKHPRVHERIQQKCRNVGAPERFSSYKMYLMVGILNFLLSLPHCVPILDRVTAVKYRACLKRSPPFVLQWRVRRDDAFALM